MTDTIRILIADDHPLFRQGVAMSLATVADFTVVGEAGTGEEAFTLAAELLPDVLLLDITMPGEGGIAAARRITAVWPVVRIIMLTVSEDQDNLIAALKAGARGYVLKGVSARELANAVRTVAEGVEDADDWHFLRAQGCHVAQGYFIGRPMPAEALPRWRAEWELRRAALTLSLIHISEPTRPY